MNPVLFSGSASKMDSQSSALVVNEEEKESTSGVVELPPVVEKEVAAVQQPPTEEIESEAFAPAVPSSEEKEDFRGGPETIRAGAD